VGGFGVRVGSFVGVAVDVEFVCAVGVGVDGTGMLSSDVGVDSSFTLAPLQPADKKIANPKRKNTQRIVRI
jgi:hypothetical protein